MAKVRFKATQGRQRHYILLMSSLANIPHSYGNLQHKRQLLTNTSSLLKHTNRDEQTYP